MKLLSLVPSITETLIQCGVDLVGRTRFCIHPTDRVAALNKVAGTKDIDWQRVADNPPDLVIFDKEENTREMADTCPYPQFVLHITSVYTVGPELARLADYLNNDPLRSIARQWQSLVQNPLEPCKIDQIPGIIQWWKPISTHSQLLYLIWKSPYMAIGNQTFIQSMLDFIGLSKWRVKFAEKYPTINLSDFDPKTTLLLCSSEPYPFAKAKADILKLGYASALVDGEYFSWYGLRSLRFLQKIKSDQMA